MGADRKLEFYRLEDAEGVAPNRKEDAEVLDGLDLRPDYCRHGLHGGVYLLGGGKFSEALKVLSNEGIPVRFVHQTLAGRHVVDFSEVSAPVTATGPPCGERPDANKAVARVKAAARRFTDAKSLHEAARETCRVAGEDMDDALNAAQEAGLLTDPPVVFGDYLVNAEDDGCLSVRRVHVFA